MKSYDITSVCNALMDVLIEISEEDLRTLGLTKGVMHLVDSERQLKVLHHFKDKPRVTELGGSAMNAIRTLAQLGHKTVFAGMVNDDEFGLHIRDRMKTLGIKSYLGGHSEESTGTCLILITPDGERTMNTNLGASRLYNPTHIPHDEIARSHVFHFCGYQWDTSDQKSALTSSIKTAHENNTIISFDLADPFVVDRNRIDFIDLIQSEADIVFANKEEACLLFNTSPEDTARRIAATGSIAVIKLGSEGALVAKGSDEFRIAPVKTKVIDTTAAGDMFAAGFLHGFLRGKPIPVCGQVAAVLASDVISRVGAIISDDALSVARGLTKDSE
jgi:sugar/nucleoside kinase (ribokinase family)